MSNDSTRVSPEQNCSKTVPLTINNIGSLNFKEISSAVLPIFVRVLLEIILNNKSSFNNNTDLLLYLAARSENMDNLKKNFRKKIILIDRFTDSTIAYQHFGMGVNLDIIKKINNHILKSFKVDFTFLSIVNTNNMQKRLKLKLN